MDSGRSSEDTPMNEPVQQLPPKPPVLTRAEAVIIWVLSALLLGGVGALLMREAVRARNAPDVERTSQADMGYLIDLNTATCEELALLPGIGLSMAKEIVAHRERIGGFKAPDQLAEVNGISKPVLAKVLPFVTVSQRQDNNNRK